LIIFEWYIEALKENAKVLYCQYVLPRHHRMKRYCKNYKKSNQKNIIALQRLSEVKTTQKAEAGYF